MSGMKAQMPLALIATVFGLALGAAHTPLVAAEMTWRQVDADQLVFMELQEGRVVIELNPLFAPATVKQFRELVERRFYDGLGFYRVIDGFVAQGGDGSDLGELSNVPLIAAEFEREAAEEIVFTPVQQPDLFAHETGFVDGFPAARDARGERLWIVHCPGIVAMARNESPDSSRTDFYIVIGQAPRYLDRNMNVFARVIDGMEVLQRIRRGPPGDNGIIRTDTGMSRIRSMRLASDIDEDQRLDAFVMDSTSEGFAEMLDQRRVRKQKFFHHRPPEVLDVCQVPMTGRVTK